MTAETNQTKFKTDVLDVKDTPVLVDFWAPWCGPCLMQGPIIDELAKEVGNKAKIFKVNVDENGELAGQYGIMSIPALKVFKNGEEVFNRGILTNIEYHRAVVRSNSRTFTYSMPFEEVGETPSERQQEAVANQPLSLVQKVREYEWAIDRRALNNMLNDMDKVLTDARLLPYSDSGKVIGFRIGEVKPNGVFRLIGLQNGDILLKVNDYEINSPERGLQLLNGLRGETKVSLDIIRNGKPARLQYQIR